MTILVTGATGHLGANLALRLSSAGVPTRVLMRRSETEIPTRGLKLEYVYGDLREPQSLREALSGVKQVYHCAALVSVMDGDRAHRQALFETNVLGTRNLLRAALEAGVERVVVTSSQSASGTASNHLLTEALPPDPFAPRTPYAVTKVMMEHECLKAVADGLDVVIASSTSIIGPNDFKPSRLGLLLIDFANGRLPAYIQGGFEAVAAQDIVEGHLLAMAHGRAGQKYHFTTEFLTVERLLSIFSEVTGQPVPRFQLPPKLMTRIAAIADWVLPRLGHGGERRFCRHAIQLLRLEQRVDCSKAKRELGYQPTSIKSAVENAFEDFKRNGVIQRSPLPLQPAEAGYREVSS